MSVDRKIELVVLDEASMCAAGLLAVLLVILFPVLSPGVMLVIVGDHLQDKTREIRLQALPQPCRALLSQTWSRSVFEFVFSVCPNSPSVTAGCTR